MILDNNTLNPPAKKRATGTIIIVSLVIFALVGTAVWYLFFRGGSDIEEKTAYDNIIRYENAHQLDSLGEALNDYFDTYNADAFHYSQLKDLYDRFSTERDDWLAMKDNMSLEAVRQFLGVHPDGFYLSDATRKLDSLSYVDACATNTREAYEHYLDQFSQGKFVAEVRKQISELDNEELTIEEKATVKEVLTTHFDALGDNDKGAIVSTLAEEINSYIGKANPELEDIYAYMSNMHASGRMIVFNIKNANIIKVDAGGRSMYNVQFSLEEETYARGSHATLDTESSNPPEGEKPVASDVKTFSGIAVLDENMKITSVVLRK